MPIPLSTWVVLTCSVLRKATIGWPSPLSATQQRSSLFRKQQSRPSYSLEGSIASSDLGMQYHSRDLNSPITVALTCTYSQDWQRSLSPSRSRLHGLAFTNASRIDLLFLPLVGTRTEEVSRSPCVGPRSDSSTLNTRRSIRLFFILYSAITTPASNFSSFFPLHRPIALADKRHAGPFLLVGPRQTACLPYLSYSTQTSSQPDRVLTVLLPAVWGHDCSQLGDNP